MHLNSTVKRLFTLPSMGRGVAPEGMGTVADHLTVAQIKAEMLDALKDCESPTTARIRYRIEHCVTATELWLMRSDVFQAVSGRHSQSEAGERVNRLLHCFKGWIPSSQLLPVKASLGAKPPSR
jgi:hypothetical protein